MIEQTTDYAFQDLCQIYAEQKISQIVQVSVFMACNREDPKCR